MTDGSESTMAVRSFKWWGTGNLDIFQAVDGVSKDALSILYGLDN